jgi:hypothetical protein
LGLWAVLWALVWGMGEGHGGESGDNVGGHGPWGGSRVMGGAMGLVEDKGTGGLGEWRSRSPTPKP